MAAYSVIEKKNAMRYVHDHASVSSYSFIWPQPEEEMLLERAIPEYRRIKAT